VGNNTLLEAALSYAAQGFKVFPLKPGGKIPITPHGLKDASQLQATIKEYWRKYPNANIGLVCDGLLALDFDGKAGAESKKRLIAKYGELPRTWVIKTGGGTQTEPKEQGEHYVYRVPTDLNIRPGAGKYGFQNLDIRANDSYIVAAPSITRLPYESIDDSPVTDAPCWLIDMARNNGSKPTSRQKQGTPIPDTTRNATLTSIAGAMRRKGADQGAIEAALLKINASQCQPPLSEREVLRIAESVSRYEPKPDTEQPAHFNLTDYGNAERLVRLYGSVIRYGPERKAWLIWTGKVWEWDMGGVRFAKLAKKTARNIYREAADEPDDDLRKELVKHARATERQVRLDAMIKSAESESGIAVSLADLDANHWLLNVSNGTIDLRTGVLKSHDPADLITEILPLDYNPSASSTEWDTFLSRIFNDDTKLIAYVQRALGYSISGDQSEQVFFFCYGSGFNGKSTLLNAARLVVGNYATQVPPTAFMVDKTKRGGPDEAIASLRNKRLVCSTELEDGQRLSVSLVKRMTGGEPLWCEHKFEHGYNFQPTHKLWLSGNHEPVITDTTNSIWYRLKKIPFTIDIPEADRKKGYGEYLAKEHGAAILAWLVKGCIEWRQSGTLGEPEAVTKAVAEYRDQQDILHDYLFERCIFQKSATIAQKALYADYKQWAEDNDVNAIGKLTFRTRIQEKGATVATGNRNIKIWRGIRLRTDSDGDVTSGTSVTDFSESLLREASTEKTLLGIGNKSNKNNTGSSGELPDCPVCGRNEWTYTADGELKCPCGHKQDGDK
jgi:putative DNA primase/helicase